MRPYKLIPTPAEACAARSSNTHTQLAAWVSWVGERLARPDAPFPLEITSAAPLARPADAVECGDMWENLGQIARARGWSVDTFDEIVGEERKAAPSLFSGGALVVLRIHGSAVPFAEPALRYAPGRGPVASELVEAVSDLGNERWARWAAHMLDAIEAGLHHHEELDAIPVVERWRRRIATPYEDLPESEKDSDREWARKVLALVDLHGG